MGSNKKKLKDKGTHPNESLTELNKPRKDDDEEEESGEESSRVREKKSTDDSTSKKKLKKSGGNKKMKRSESSCNEEAETEKEPKEIGSTDNELNPDPFVEEQPERKPSPMHDVEEDSDSDEELLAAAAAWAENRKDEKEDERKKKRAIDEENQRKSVALSPKQAQGDKRFEGQTKNLSLHITQLPFDANELDLRRLFAENGCSITSIRLVYDKDEHGRKTVFRGVAFVDVLDDGGTSYQAALALNRKAVIRGRRLNIRPTRSKQELADIVTRTRELVQEKIRRQQEEGNADDNNGGTGTLLSKKQRKKQKQKEKKAKAREAHKAKENKAKHKLSKKEGNRAPGSGTSPGNKKGKGGSKKTAEEDRKMTKKERNRRAAIIMGLKNRRK